MDLALAEQSYQEGADGSAEVVCLNMFACPKPATDGRQYELRTCPGLSQFVDLTDKVRGMIATDGLFNGDLFVVSGGNLKRVDSAGTITTIGALPASGNVTMAASRIEIAICVAPNLYIYDGTSLTQVTDPDLPDVTSVDYINQRFVMTDENDRLYWTDLLDGKSVDGLNFLTAESLPDRAKRVFSDGESLYVMGDASIELVGPVTNPATAASAFARLGSGVLKQGLASFHAVAADRSTKLVGFLGTDRVVYITTGYELSPISTPYIERLLSSASLDDIQATRFFTYSEEGETFLVMNVPNVGCFSFGRKLQKWHRRQTFTQTSWRANQYVNAFGKDYVASNDDGKVWLMSRDTLTDIDSPIERRWSASAPVRNNNSISDIALDGYASAACRVSMRKRKPGSYREYGDYVDRSMQSPDQACKPLWRRLGKTFPPEEMFEFRITDAAEVVITGVRANDGFIR